MRFQSIRDPHFREGGLEAGKSVFMTFIRHFQTHSVVSQSIYKGMRTHYDLTGEIRRIFSVTPGFIVTFNIIGQFTDPQNTRRNVVNQHSIGKFQKSIDRTISEARRTVKYLFQFVPIEGGDRKKQVSYHIHGLIELPPHSNPYQFQDLIKKKFQNQVEKVFNPHERIEGKVWFEPIQTDKLFGYTKYTTRSEDDYRTDNLGDWKILVNMSSFCLEWHQR